MEVIGARPRETHTRYFSTTILHAKVSQPCTNSWAYRWLMSDFFIVQFGLDYGARRGRLWDVGRKWPTHLENLFQPSERLFTPCSPWRVWRCTFHVEGGRDPSAPMYTVSKLPSSWTALWGIFEVIQPYAHVGLGKEGQGGNHSAESFDLWIASIGSKED